MRNARHRTAPARRAALAVAATASALAAPASLSLLTATPASASPTTPDVQWARDSNAVSNETVQDSAFDAAGNLYVAGFFGKIGDPSPKVTLVGNGVTLTANGNGASDTFVAKYRPDGTPEWLHRIGGGGRDGRAALAVTPAGDVAVVSSVESGGTIDATEGPITINNGAGTILSRFNNDGSLVYALPVDASGAATANDVEITPAGFVTVAGFFSGDLTVGSGASASSVSSAGLRDAFWSRFNGAGTHVGTNRVGGTLDDEWNASALDADGELYLTGRFESTFQLFANNSIYLLSPKGDGDVITAKRGTSDWAWIRTGGSTGEDSGTDIAVIGEEATVVGTFEGNATFGGVALSSAGATDGFALRYASDGAPQKGVRFGGNLSDSASALAPLPSGRTAITGTFNGTAQIGSTTVVSEGGRDAFTAMLAEDLTLGEGTRIGGDGEDAGMTIAADHDGSILAGGTFEQSVTVGWAGAAASLTANGAQSDAYLVKYSGKLGGYHGLTSKRVLDTRDGTGGVSISKIGPGGGVEFAVANGTPGLPPFSNTAAVVLNLTGTGGTAATHLTAYPSGGSVPATSNLNLATGETAANLVTVRVGANGKIRIINNTGQVDVIADIVGYYDNAAGPQVGGGYHALTPARILDSRDGTGTPLGKVGAGLPNARAVKVTGVGGVPASGVGAVVLNVTGILPGQDTHLTLWPSGSVKPAASNLNLAAGTVRPNLVIVQPGPTGHVLLFNNSGQIHVAADVVGWFDQGNVNADRAMVFSPVRILDTRDGTGAPQGKLAAAATITLDVRGVGGVPKAGVHAVILNVTVTGPSETSHLTVWPSGQAKPLASNLNYVAGQTVPNLVMASVGDDGKIKFANNSGNTHVIADVVGWIG